jgi:hypothetical protein
MADPVAVYLETTPKKTFACALDWPGWCRAGKTEELALEALSTYAARYRRVVAAAGVKLGPSPGLAVVERIEGGSGTTFGVPSAIAERDRHRVSGQEAERLSGIVEASWMTFDRIAAGAPAELRKGPRGGGRDRDKIVGHVVEADQAYAREIGLRERSIDPADHDAVWAMRRRMLEVLGRPSGGAPLADRKWTLRYAARRIAWHALDHAWEIQDRSEPAVG